MRTVSGVAVFLVVIAGCSAEVAVQEPEGDVTVVVGTDDLLWEPEHLQIPSGGAEVDLVCQPAANHNLVIVETGEQVAICAPGETDRGTVDLDPGEYVFLCTVPGHSATMRGELTVTE